MNKKTLKMAFIHSYMSIITVPMLFMIVWYLFTAVYNGNTNTFTLDNFAFITGPIEYAGITLPMIWPIVWNTLVYAFFIVVIETVISVPTAYAFSRLEFKGRKFAMKFLFIMRSFPGVTLIIATFFILVQMGLVDTYTGVILVAITGSLPGHVYIMKGFFDEVPWDLEWAAMTDGCTRWRAFRKVILPSVGSGIAAISIFSFLGAYGEWFLFKLLIFSDTRLVIGGYIAKLITKEETILNYGLVCALGLFYTLPVIVFYVLSQKALMKVNIGGSKGV